MPQFIEVMFCVAAASEYTPTAAVAMTPVVFIAVLLEESKPEAYAEVENTITATIPIRIAFFSLPIFSKDIRGALVHSNYKIFMNSSF